MQRKVEQFHLIDLASQAGAVQSLLIGVPPDAKVQWLAAHGAVEFVPSPVPGYRDTYRFTSYIGFESLFFIDGDLFVFIGDNTTWAVLPP